MTINGIGFELTMAAGFSYEKYADFIKKHAENLKEKATESEAVRDFLKECEDYTYYKETECYSSGALTAASFLSNIMFFETGIRFSAYDDAEDYDVSAGIVMFEENFPWCMTEFERNMTKQVLDDIFSKYMKELGMDISVPDNICVDTDI